MQLSDSSKEQNSLGATQLGLLPFHWTRFNAGSVLCFQDIWEPFNQGKHNEDVNGESENEKVLGLPVR